MSLWGEFLEAREERKGQGPTLEDLPDVLRPGLVGDRHLARHRRAQDAHHPPAAAGSSRGPGAVELSARYEELVVRRREQRRLRVGRAAGPRTSAPRRIRAFTGGLSWWPTAFLRFQGNVLLERYDDPLRAPEPGNTGDYVSLLGRVQVHLP